MKSKRSLVWLYCAVLVLCVVGSLAQAQTPLDANVMQVTNSFRTTWAPLFIMIGGIGIALGLGYALHAGPQVLMGLVIGFLILFLIGAAANGSLQAWVGL